MYCVRLIAAATIAAASAALAGCSGSSFSMPSISMPEWLSSKQQPSLQTLQFESMPPGADVQTSQGQTCRTPCALALPLIAQSVTFAMKGYATQSVPVEVHQTEHSMFDTSAPPADFQPNPVTVTLQTLKKPLAKPRKNTAAMTTSAAKSAAPAAASPADATPDSFPAPSSSQPQLASPFPPSPTQAR